MVSFSDIPNEKLQTLALNSAAIATLRDVEKYEMIIKFKQANAKDQNRYIAILEQEQKDIQENNAKWLEDVAQAATDLNEATQGIRHIESDVLKIEESQSRERDDIRAQEIVNQLQFL